VTLTEMAFFWPALAGYGVATFLLLLSLASRKENLLRGGRNFLRAAFILHTAALALRWYQTGHMPGANIYELSSAGAWCTILAYQILLARYRHMSFIGPPLLLISLAMLLQGVSRSGSMGPLSEEYQSLWFYLHAVAAFLAYACYAIAAAAGILILGDSRLRPRMANLPGPELLLDMNSRFVAHGFFYHAVMLTSGSVWADSAWGRYWGWDPVETWSLVAWLLFAFHLHSRRFLGWNGKRLAWLTLLALSSVFLAFWGVSHLPA